MLTHRVPQLASPEYALPGTATWSFPAADHARHCPDDRAGTAMSFARNAEIYSESDPADHLYRIVSGVVRTCKLLADGRRQVIAFYLPGDTFGLETQAEHPFSAEAVVHVRVRPARRATMASAQLWELMQRELQSAQDHLRLLVTPSKGRVASFLLDMARRIGSSEEVELPMPRRDVADYLGLTIETVSRTMTQLESQSAISLPTSRRIVLRDRAALARLVA
jgi:CRP/FNR family nitrogen fixation transcriptional regulator